MIKGVNIVLRAPEPEDLETLYRWENNTDIWQVSNTVAPFSKHVLQEYLSSAAHHDIYTTKQLRLMIDRIIEIEGRESVGCIDLFDFDPNNMRVGVGVLIADAENRNKGLASEALKLLIGYCFEKLNVHQLYCNITTNNEASLKLFKNHGFLVSGLKKDWIRIGDKFVDEYTLQLVR